MTALPTVYQEFIAVSRYARFRSDLGRRETWHDTTSRYGDFWHKHFKKVMTSELSAAIDEAQASIETLDNMPSMRSLMTAGPALERSHTAGYNCSAATISGSGPTVELWDDKLRELGHDEPIKVKLHDPLVFDEAFYILLCGTGFGFSVERQFVNDLPKVGKPLSRASYKKNAKNFPKIPREDLSSYDKKTNTIAVADSKEGWSSSLRIFIVELYNGNFSIKHDTSGVRPAGQPLKIFGGRSSGPEALVKMFEEIRAIFVAAEGRKLTSIECHDIMCHIASAVVVGGVRRAAQLSLSNLSDERMRYAKSGNWWIDNPQRSLANNSVAYTEKPEIGQFMREWQALYESKSGERGIFNREAAILSAAAHGRTLGDDCLVNPCCFAGSNRLLTKYGYKTFAELAELSEVQIVEPSGSITTGSVWSVGVKPVIDITMASGAKIRCTPDHRFMLEDGTECEAQDLAGKRPKTYGAWPDKAILVEAAGEEEVFDFTEPKTHWGVVEGFVVHNSEILLQSNQMCNLSSSVIRPDDTLETLKEKVRISTFIGTMQATLTDFSYLSPVWKETCEEERLLGVSLPGGADHPILSQVSDEAKRWLKELSTVVDETNAKWAKLFGINAAAGKRCQKPAGNSGELYNVASGIHPRYAPFYTRRVRADGNDPLAKVMRAQGFPCEVDVMHPNTLVFSFPVKAPAAAVLRNDRTAMEQLEYWLMWKQHWSDHSVSATIYVKEHEWLQVGAWVYEHFDEITGLSFLPHSDHSYKQAPYEEITEAEYEEMSAIMPAYIDYDALSKLEVTDHTTSSQEFACAGGACEIM